MRILGIDPGLATMGYGIIESDRGKQRLIAYGVVTTPPKMPTPDRLYSVFSDVKQLLALYKPDEAVFEELFFAKNITTAMNVSAARGAALCACAEYGCPLFEYTPMQIKQAVVGYGKADKHQIQQMVKLMLKLEDIPRPDDAADAVAAALTHAATGVQKEQFRMK